MPPHSSWQFFDEVTSLREQRMGLDTADAIEAGMKAKAEEFAEKGGEVYVEAE